MGYDILYETIIIGARPAGFSAGPGALYASRAGHRQGAVYRNERSYALHCFLGPDGIAPRELLERSRRQLEHQ